VKDRSTGCVTLARKLLVMEYRCSTRCEDDSLENEKGIGIAVRDARQNLPFESSSSRRICSDTVTVRVTVR